eukprot:Phypoly_transcript_14612.p1 GENE.Phypoly_transcript_14612~~Phypoly_transcript_14612.p1  ORF type:complete len:298 (+),score=26.38 Phypoly_transcript_14612:60-953(+)
MVKPAPGIVAVECIGIALYLIPLVLSVRMLLVKFGALSTTRRIFYILMVAFCMVREIHISLNFSRAEGAPPFNEKKYAVRNNNMIIWTAALGVYLLYSALMILVYEWAALLTRASLESHKRLTVIVIVVITTFNLEYWALLTAHVKSGHSMEAAAYASIECASIATLIPALFYYFKIVRTLQQSKCYHPDKHKKILRKLGIVIVPISMGLVLRSGIAWAVAVKGNTFLNFYVWITLFWMLPELVPVTIMLIAINPSSQPKKDAGVSMPDHMRTPSTLHLQSTDGSGVKTPSDSSGDV